MDSDDDFRSVMVALAIFMAFAVGFGVGSIMWRNGSESTAYHVAELEGQLAIAQERVAELTIANGELTDRQLAVTNALEDAGRGLVSAAFTARSIDQLIDRIIEHVNDLERLYYEAGEVGRVAP